jgi:hypothetical protein
MHARHINPVTGYILPLDQVPDEVIVRQLECCHGGCIAVNKWLAMASVLPPLASPFSRKETGTYPACRPKTCFSCFEEDDALPCTHARPIVVESLLQEVGSESPSDTTSYYKDIRCLGKLPCRVVAEEDFRRVLQPI